MVGAMGYSDSQLQRLGWTPTAINRLRGEVENLEEIKNPTRHGTLGAIQVGTKWFAYVTTPEGRALARRV